ncbi:MFS transporter [Helcobacillus massiliensis]|uniref:Putative MFS transporter n=1 Tax=Helcobacillus massiliensis TaxID=521392 RepID=A0A839QNK3_9MICO|nr:MFS transporter [Helcobacillus massiliensis]MBB3021884.1 putative MFS transporter [Helcobacillus massiliensis]
MARTATMVDEVPLNRFHIKLTAFSSGGPFIDGYALSVLGIALLTLQPALGMSAAEVGLLGASTLIGIFVGGGVFGWVTDKVGRHTMYIVDLIALAVFSIASGLATETWHVIAARFLLGVAIGADYPIATSLLAEFLPRKYRGRLLGASFVVWAVGAAAAYAVGFMLKDIGPDAWRWLLASPALFAIITLLFRLGTPESPRWLYSKGRFEECRAVIKKVWGPDFDLENLGEVDESDAAPRATFKTIFQGVFLKRTLFVALFWTLQVIPMFAVYTFAPDLLKSFGMHGDANLYGGSLLISSLFVVGGIPGLWLVEKIGRKSLLAGTFAIGAVALAIPFFIPNVPAEILFTALAIFAISSGAANFLQIVYPNELFPTEVRATAVGVGTALSRIGSAVSTYLMPLMILNFGASKSLMAGAVIALAGLLVTILLGEETMGRSLKDTATGEVPVVSAKTRVTR